MLHFNCDTSSFLLVQPCWTLPIRAEGRRRKDEGGLAQVIAGARDEGSGELSPSPDPTELYHLRVLPIPH